MVLYGSVFILAYLESPSSVLTGLCQFKNCLRPGKHTFSLCYSLVSVHCVTISCVFTVMLPEEWTEITEMYE